MTFSDAIFYLRDINTIAIIFKFILAIICGGVIGADRGRKKQAAGLRTHLLVCIGAASVMMVNQYAARYLGATDVTRMGAQVISGIGFLGAGTIIVTGHKQVRGLTTAAGLWASACMGLAIGIGFYECAIIMCILLFAVLQMLNRLESKFIKREKNLCLYIEYEGDFRLSYVLKILNEDGWGVEGIEYLNKEKEGYGSLHMDLSKFQGGKDIQSIIERIQKESGVFYVDKI